MLSPAEARPSRGASYFVCSFDPAKDELRIFWRGDEACPAWSGCTRCRSRVGSARSVANTKGDPSIFAKVRVADHGRALRWPGEINYCADALWVETKAEDAPNEVCLSKAASKALRQAVDLHRHR